MLLEVSSIVPVYKEAPIILNLKEPPFRSTRHLRTIANELAIIHVRKLAEIGRRRLFLEYQLYISTARRRASFYLATEGNGCSTRRILF